MLSDRVDGPTLVVCPTSVLGNWEREVNRFAPELSVMVHHGAGRMRDHDVPFAERAVDCNVVLTSYHLVARDIDAASRAARAATGAIEPMPDVITPFPGGVTRSGSRVGSKYKSLIASTNDAYCPTVRGISDSQLGEGENAVLEIVLDGLSFEAIADAMRAGIRAACESCGEHGLIAVTAGNYGGKLGRHHFHLHEILA